MSSVTDRHAAGLLRVLELTRALAGQYVLEDLLSEVLALGMRLLDAEMGALWLYREESEELVTLLPKLATPLHERVGEGLAGLCAAERGIINVFDAARDPRLRGAVET